MHRVVALIRFSFLASDNRGYRLTRDLTFEKKQKVLFAEDRMEERFDVFERVCLPSLVAQPSSDFAAVLLASEFMPGRYKDRLETLLGRFSNIIPTFASPRPFPYSEAFLEPIATSEQSGGLIFTCRLDDDDALSSGYTEQALAYLDPKHEGFCISFARGLQAARVGRQPRFWESFYPLIGAGLGYVSRADSGRTIYDCRHHERVWNAYPTVVDGRTPHYLVTLHGSNDSMSRRPTPKRSWWKRRRPKHQNERRTPPNDTYSPQEVREKFGEYFAPLTESDWHFL